MEWAADLWNDDALSRHYGGRAEAYQTAVLAQYTLYVEMADRVSQRRALANTFFLTLNTGVLTAAALTLERAVAVDPAWLVLPVLGLIGQCAAWYSALRSYRLLNTAKYRVIGALEERLPASPYFRAEWGALGQGRDRRRYWPLTHIERWVPVLFAVLYAAGLLAALLGG